MIHSRLVNFLNKFKFMQIILGVLPALLVMFFIFFYMLDLANIISVLTYNNSVVDINYNAGMLYEANSINDLGDETIIEFKGDDKKIVNY